jgi:hypothetical protein
MSDLQDIIAQSTLRAFNAGYNAGRQDVIDAVNFVKFEYHDLEIAAISDLEEELEARVTMKQGQK